MAIGLYDSKIFGPLFSDAEVAALFTDAAQVEAWVRVEAALARVQGRLGTIPAEAAEAIENGCATFVADLDGLRRGVEASGIPTIALIEQLRAAVGGEAAQYLHWGATTQDIMDSGLVLRLCTLMALFDARLERVVETLANLAKKHRDTPMAAHTHGQQALPTTFGLKAAQWLAPLAAHRKRLKELRPRVLVVQFGGAAGTLAALGERGLETMDALAKELGLSAPVAPWHAQRESLAELAGWCSLVTGSLGKIGQDIVLLSQSEVGEVAEGAAGGSSTMPQKANPVASELLVAAARINAGLLATLHQTLIAEQERATHGWQLEWLVLPQIAACTGAALGHAERLCRDLVVKPDYMAENLEASNGLVLAEAASFALAAHLPRPEAQALIKQACKDAAASARHLIDVLADLTDAPLDWNALRDPKNYLGEAGRLTDRILRAAKQD